VLPTKWALGYSVGRLGSQDSTSAFGIGGSGGSFAYGDHAKGVSCAVTKNLLTPDFNSATQIIGIVNAELSDGARSS